jgi:hypothetical protein
MDNKIRNAIPANFVMISGSEDKQTSADVGNVGSFSLPDPAGKAGGACTSTLLKVLNENKGRSMSWIDVLQQMRSVLKKKGFDQVPQLSSSRMMDVKNSFEIVPQQSRGRRRVSDAQIDCTCNLNSVLTLLSDCGQATYVNIRLFNSYSLFVLGRRFLSV